jgi:hypothetical protein
LVPNELQAISPLVVVERLDEVGLDVRIFGSGIDVPQKFKDKLLGDGYRLCHTRSVNEFQ